jgi:deoxyadenosine kinase
MTKTVKPTLQDLFIGIAGLIGAGKSTLATAIGAHTGLPVYYEPVQDNEYLADFYKETSKYAFSMQIYLLNRRFQQHQEIIWQGGGAIQDRTIYEDAIFAKTLLNLGLLNERDYRTYLALFKNMSNFMCRPNFIIYLDIQPETSMERIQMRSRDVESEISLEYLQMLYKEYEIFIEEIARTIPVIRVPWERFHDADEVAEMIEREYLHTSFIRNVGWSPVRGV